MGWQFGWTTATVVTSFLLPLFCAFFFYSRSLVASNPNVFSPFPLPRYFCKHLTPERATLQYWEDSPRWAIVPSCALPAILSICVLVKLCQIYATKTSFGPTFCASRSARFSGVEMVVSVCAPGSIGNITHVKLSSALPCRLHFTASSSPVPEQRSHDFLVPPKRAAKTVACSVGNWRADAFKRVQDWRVAVSGKVTWHIREIFRNCQTPLLRNNLVLCTRLLW